MIMKLDIVLLTLMSLAYLVAYLDRNNIGNARLMNFEKDLKLSSQQFYNATMVYYAGYLTVVFPANLLLRKVGPKYLLGSAVILFGLFVCCICSARGYADLVGLRYGIGCAEAMLQTTPLYMVAWYGRNELGKRVGIFYSVATLSGVFSSFIAYGIQKDLTIPGKRPAWQWLFLVEGVLALAVGLIMILLLPSFPDRVKSSWLFSKQEIDWAIKRNAGFQVKLSLLDPNTYLMGFVNIASATMLASIGVFMPTIVKSFGFSPVRAQLFTAIPYACGFVSMIGIGILSDRYQNKGFFILGSFTSCVLGLVILLSTTTMQAGMAGVCFLVLGAYPAVILVIAWIQISFCGSTKRAVSWGVAMVFGQGFSLLGTQIYTTPPRFVKGHATLLGLVVWAMLSTVASMWIMAARNRGKERALRECAERGEQHPDSGKSLEETCDSHVNFRYTL
ncbi:retrograde regulation protein 2 [Talaromyces proteolyticus]|uniref:Retrograde regulation protein 2 n=1 Tax=Talaromyces proteolyticus TaxID=1131652 RepID=A0AAD4KWR5_9EURO|nr:retrograde regulation protein 2 [Talaromyces proteolyticus]KAH8701746.1 retrograde regulation protein 2 [Talaromyces proteolyticus]